MWRKFSYTFATLLRGLEGLILAGVEGLEPPTDDLEGRYSIHLSYTPNLKRSYMISAQLLTGTQKSFAQVIDRCHVILSKWRK